MRWRTIAIACLGLVALSANAQVHRCKDAAGKTFYSDRPCDAGQTGQLIERQRSQAEIMRERQQAAEANERKYERQAAEQAMQPAPPPSQMAQPPLPQREGWQQRKDRENAETAAKSITRNGGRWDEKAEAERKAERKAAMIEEERRNPPKSFPYCDPAFCYDNNGRAYSKSGNDVLVSPTGRTCHRSGGMWVCT